MIERHMCLSCIVRPQLGKRKTNQLQQVTTITVPKSAGQGPNRNQWKDHSRYKCYDKVYEKNVNNVQVSELAALDGLLEFMLKT